jgi:hypothetical protein
MAESTFRRSRWVAAGAATAALAVAVPAFAGGSGEASAPATDPAAATQAVQDTQPREDRRDCPRERGSESQSAPSAEAPTPDARQL